MSSFKKIVNSVFGLAGFEVRRVQARTSGTPAVQMPVEFSAEECRVVEYVKSQGLSMASYERLWATVMACRHVIERGVQGDFVECGVWRGDNALIAASVFKLHGAGRKVYLFDTFQGMTEPTDEDRSAVDGASAMRKFRASQQQTLNDWCYASMDDVRNNFREAGLLDDNLCFVLGDVLKTLADPSNLPDRIAVLRLDTDWYDSTRKELEVLYPRLETGGALIIDDYGHWAGAKKATDEYFSAHGGRPLLQYSDYAGRLGIKY